MTRAGAKSGSGWNGALLPSPRPSPKGRGSKTGPEPRTDEAHHLLPRLHLALRVPRVRAVAAGTAGPELHGGLPADPVRGAAQAPRPARPGRDRRQARVDLPPGAVAGARAWRPDADAGRASLQ